jgi:uncharacterized coiled-coil protein SlyX
MVIEEKIAYQEHTLQILNERIVSQQQQIDTLVTEVRQLTRQLQALAMAGGIDVAAGEAPPHY